MKHLASQRARRKKKKKIGNLRPYWEDTYSEHQAKTTTLEETRQASRSQLIGSQRKQLYEALMDAFRSEKAVLDDAEL